MPSILIPYGCPGCSSYAGARALIIKPTTNDHKLRTKVDGAETSRHYRPLAFEHASVVWSTRRFRSKVGHLHSRLLLLVLVLLMLVTGAAELPGRPSSLDLLVTAGDNTSKEFLKRRSLMVPWQETKAMSRGRRLVACDLKFSVDLLASSGGWNVLSASCVLGGMIRVGSGQTMRVKKDPSVSGPVVIDRQALAYSPDGRHFYVRGGTLEMEGVTLKGGSVDRYGGVVYVRSGSASFQACSFIGNFAQRIVSASFDTLIVDHFFLFSLDLFLCFCVRLLFPLLLHSEQNRS